MKRTILLIWLPVFLFACQHANRQKLPCGEIKELTLTADERQVAERNVDFAFRFFHAFAPDDSMAGNFFVSPLSASFALGMVLNGAASDTKTEILSALQQTGDAAEPLNRFNRKMMENLSCLDTSLVLSIANSIWIRNNYPVRASFKETNRNMFQAEVRNLDFANPGAVDVINTWCKEKTYGTIPQVIKALEDSARLILINTLYFKGKWKDVFEKEMTRLEDFHALNKKPEPVEMMHQVNDFRFMKNEYFDIAWLPYGNEAFSMVLLLPSPQKSWKESIDALTYDNWNRWKRADTTVRELDLKFPRFTLKYEKELNPVLKNLGIIKAFNRDQADLSGIANSENLFIGSVKQLSFLEINEEGTKASAATVVNIVAEEELDTPYRLYPFHVNRPFILLIEENSTGTILFMGKITELPQSKHNT